MTRHDLPEITEFPTGNGKCLGTAEHLLRCVQDVHSLPFIEIPPVVMHLPSADLLLAQIELSKIPHLELPLPNENSKRLLTDILDGNFENIAKLANKLSKNELQELLKDLNMTQQFKDTGLTATLDDKGGLVIYDMQRNIGVAFPGKNSDSPSTIVVRDSDGRYKDDHSIKSAPILILSELSMEGRKRKEKKEQPVYYPMER
jgi:hypothetical protein